jgi:hypothetical protein
MPRTYSSKIDGFVVLAFCGLALAFSLAVGGALTLPTTGRLLALVIFGPLGAGLPLWTLLRSGPSRWTIPIRDIRSITPTRALTSSPALSLDRLRIEYSDGRVLLVSPREKETFLRDLQDRRTQAG